MADDQIKCKVLIQEHTPFTVSMFSLSILLAWTFLMIQKQKKGDNLIWFLDMNLGFRISDRMYHDLFLPLYIFHEEYAERYIFNTYYS